MNNANGLGFSLLWSFWLMWAEKQKQSLWGFEPQRCRSYAPASECRLVFVWFSSADNPGDQKTGVCPKGIPIKAVCDHCYTTGSVLALSRNGVSFSSLRLSTCPYTVCAMCLCFSIIWSNIVIVELTNEQTVRLSHTHTHLQVVVLCEMPQGTLC